MILARDSKTLRDTIRKWRKRKTRIAFVPTMGALHAGHLSLIALAREQADRVICSIFVNPAQFGVGEDFSRYPRCEDEDMTKLLSEHCDMVYLPSIEEIYPQGFATRISVKGVSEGLDGAYRPGHFDGVATVVTKLLLQIAPDTAIFGEKDYQQLLVIKRLASDLELPIDIIGAPTKREDDGLAMSSRNRYLSPSQREAAPKIYQVLRAAAEHIRMGSPVKETLAASSQALIDTGFDKVDYVELCHAKTLVPLTDYMPPARLLAAARIGNTRLIDNIAVE